MFDHCYQMPQRSSHWAFSHIVPPCRRGDLIVEELDGELLVSDPSNGHACRLNQTAAAVWNLCDGRRDVRGIASDMIAAYDVDHETALDHVEQLVVTFVASNLLSSGVAQ